MGRGTSQPLNALLLCLLKECMHCREQGAAVSTDDQEAAGDAFIVDVNYFTIPYQEPHIGSWLAEAVHAMAANSTQTQDGGQESRQPMQYIA